MEISAVASLWEGRERERGELKRKSRKLRANNVALEIHLDEFRRLEGEL